MEWVMYGVTAIIGGGLGAFGKSIVDWKRAGNENSSSQLNTAFVMFKAYLDRQDRDIQALKESLSLLQEKYINLLLEHQRCQEKIKELERELVFLKK